MSVECPIHTQHRTFPDPVGTSHLGQKLPMAAFCADNLTQRAAQRGRGTAGSPHVGEGEKRERHVGAECLCNFEVDHKLVFCGSPIRTE